MSDFKILDVSLRDGGYKNNFCFTKDEAKHIIDFLENVGVDYIEVGYRNGTFKEVPDIGLTGLSSNEYLSYLRSLITSSMMVVMIHPKNVTIRDICDLHNIGIDFIRICLPKTIDEHTANIITKIKEYNIQFSFNFTRITEYNDKDLRNRFESVLKYEPNAIYFADSNGHLTPQKTLKLFNSFVNYKVDLGFHAHNNLELALANSIVAMESGVKFIDASIAGLGKGAGNLKLEVFIGYLLSLGKNTHNFNQAIKSSTYIKSKTYYTLENDSKDMIMGVLNYNQEKASLIQFDNLDHLINEYIG